VRTIDVVTTSRADYGILLPVLRGIQSHPSLHLRVVVSGSHLSALFGMTVTTIASDGFEIVDRIDVLGSSDSAEETAHAVARGIIGFSRHLASKRPDLLFVMGDRFEMHSAALAALPFRIPVAHLHGGELTAGAFDDALRHSMTKLSHLHFVSTEGARRRVLQLGEEAWRVSVSGAPSLDNLRHLRLLTRGQIESMTGLRLHDAFLLVTFHPATLDDGDPAAQACQLFDAIAGSRMPAIVTMPNADPGGRAVRAVIEDRAKAGGSIQCAETLGTDLYFSVMAQAAAMVGNSSSGIVEAASFALPVVNVGSRQDGRERPPNVIDVAASVDDIARGIARAVSPDFRRSLAGMINPYGDGCATERIVSRLASVELTPDLVQKRFVDAESGRMETRG
jgi:UDP-hydrolysing UDP-N-acetyl-D-glucosamine 2-epimerase